MKKIHSEDIISFLEQKYPLKNAQKWDHPGYSLKLKNKIINKVLICLDVNKNVVDKAINKNVDLIISYHPFRFAKSWKTIYAYDKSKKELVKKLSKEKISVYSIHTNLDSDEHGITFNMLEKLNLKNKIIKNFDYSAIVSYEKKLITLVSLIKEKLSVNTLLTNAFNKMDSIINNFYIQPGAGDIYDFLDKSKNEKIDLLITSDIKWNEQQLLNSLGVNFLIIPHKTEDIAVDILSNLLQINFNDKIQIISHVEQDFIKGC